MARIGRWTAAIAAAGEPVVAVSHKAAIRALLALATGWDMTGRPPRKLDWRCLHFFTAHADGSVDARPRERAAGMSRVFFYVQHLLGIGHLRRAATLARALAAGGFDVLLVSGGAPVAAWSWAARASISCRRCARPTRACASWPGSTARPLDEAFQRAARRGPARAAPRRGARHR